MTNHDAMKELLDAVADPPDMPEEIGVPGGASATAVAPSAAPGGASNADWFVQLAGAVASRLGERLAADRVELAVISPEGLRTVARHDPRAAAMDPSPKLSPG